VALTLNRERRRQRSDQMKLSTFALAGLAVALALPARASDEPYGRVQLTDLQMSPLNTQPLVVMRRPATVTLPV
jgi:hypothetical protein